MSEIITESDIVGATCTPDSAGHCITCSDEALEAKVLYFEQSSGLALVLIGKTEVEVDASLLDNIGPGDLLLVHGGVALAQLNLR